MESIIIFSVGHSEIAMFNKGGELTFSDLTGMSISGENEIDCDFADGQNELREFDYTLYPSNYIHGKGKTLRESKAPDMDIYDFMQEIAKDKNFSTFTIADLTNLDYDIKEFLAAASLELFRITPMQDIYKIITK